MQPVLSAAQIREVDRLTTERFGVSSLTLMDGAGLATVNAIAELTGNSSGKRILILCGKGNNGGDGAVAARLLALAGANVDVVLLGSLAQTKGDARINFEHAKSVVPFYECVSSEEFGQLLSKLSDSYDLCVDAVFGTGLSRPIDGPQREALRYVNRGRAGGAIKLVVSIDVPSGLDSDSGNLIGDAIQADATVSMTAPKPANVLSPAANRNGKLIVADIGSPVELVEAAGSQLFVSRDSDARHWLVQTRYKPASYKKTHGHALIIAGSSGLTGAAVLCGNAAMRAGAGLVTVATPASSQAAVAARLMPEVMTAPLAETDRGAVSDRAIDHVEKLVEKVTAVAVGPGLTAAAEDTRKFVKNLVEHRQTPVVIDADGLNCLAPWPPSLRGSKEFPIVLTPHPGEMLRLTGGGKAGLEDRVAAVRTFATANSVILVLKGERALIGVPDGRVIVNPTGNSGLGTAGAGDTLTGIIAGFLAQEYGTRRKEANALDAIVAALYIGGLAGDLAAQELGMRSMVASDIREHLSAAICALDSEGETPSRK